MVAEIRPRPRRHGLSKRELLIGLPLVIAALLVVVAVVVSTFVYAVFGTSFPFPAEPNDPPPYGGRIAALVLGVVFLVLLGGFAWTLIRQLNATHLLAFDSQGVWLARGRRVHHGLRWHQIAAVTVVGPAGSTAVSPEAASPPFVELFPVDAVEDDHSPLGSRVVDAEPPNAGLRSQRYVIELAESTDHTVALAAAADRLAAGKRVTGSIS